MFFKVFFRDERGGGDQSHAHHVLGLFAYGTVGIAPAGTVLLFR